MNIAWFRQYSKEIYLSILLILVAGASFGLGRLSIIEDRKVPVTIHYFATSTQASVVTSLNQKTQHQKHNLRVLTVVCMLLQGEEKLIMHLFVPLLLE